MNPFTFLVAKVPALSYNKSNEVLKFILWIELYMFRTVSLSTIRRAALYMQE